MENWLICWEGIASTKLFMVATCHTCVKIAIYVLKTKFSILFCTQLIFFASEISGRKQFISINGRFDLITAGSYHCKGGHVLIIFNIRSMCT